ncbi:MAG: hypothetical protein ABI333_25985 [bacterium]
MRSLQRVGGWLVVVLTTGVLIACGSGTIHGDQLDGAVDGSGSGDDAASLLPDAATDAGNVPDGGCVPATCASLGYECGQWDDGCSVTLDCGGCGVGGTCNGGTCEGGAVDCSGIANNASFELCDSGTDYCAGVFTNYEGCVAYCAAAGLQCSARYGGEPGCSQEPQTVIACTANNGHQSDWCVCTGGTVNPTCPPDPANPAAYQEQHYTSAAYFNRSAWVLTCYDYAYTAQYAEHEACDSQYSAGSGQGSATFTFTAGRGMYDVFVEGRHTDNRNPAGMLTVVTSNGQSYSQYIDQQDSSGALTLDLHGNYCLDGTVEVLIDSTVSGASDSVRRVLLVPTP